MAYTKVFPIRKRLDKTVAYAANEKKTGLAAAIQYAVNRSKTEKRLYESALNCQRPQTAYREMSATKKRWGKQDGVLGYHFIQSFKPGEVTPEQAHEIGVEFAQRLFGTRFEVVIGTHLDKKHLHNHIVINSVSFLDGKKYHSSPASYYNKIRGTSDTLCKEHNLSIIEATGKGKHYAEWKAEKNGSPTLRDLVRANVEDALQKAFTYKMFLDNLKKQGYLIKAGPNIKYTAIQPPGSSRYIRLKSLGPAFTEGAIRQRISQQRSQDPIRNSNPGQYAMPDKIITTQHRTRRFIQRSPRKLRGFQALYFKYLYLLRKTAKRRLPNQAAFLLRTDMARFQRYQRQFKFLFENQIESQTQIELITAQTQEKLKSLAESRKQLYAERRRCQEDETEPITTQIHELTTEMREQRKIVYLCAQITADIVHVQNQLQSVPILQKELKKEEVQYEYS